MVNYAVSHVGGMNRGSQEEFECVISSGMLGKSATKSTPDSISCRWDQPGRTLSSESNAVESGSNQARCSVKAIHDIISGFDERKKELVESMVRRASKVSTD